MESGKSNEVKVGIFVSIGICILVAFIIIIGSERSIFQDFYTLKVKFPQVQGIRSGSVVQLQGFPVGNVDTISFDGQGSLVVNLRIDTNYRYQITQGSTASVRTQGALGDKFILITPARSTKPIANDGFLVPDIGGDFLSTLSEKGSDVEYVFEIIKEVRDLVKSVNSENQVVELIDNFRDSSRELKQALIKVNKMLGDPHNKYNKANIEQTLSKLNSIVDKIDSGEGTLGALVNDPSLHHGLKNLLSDENSKPSLKGVVRQSIQQSE